MNRISELSNTTHFDKISKKSVIKEQNINILNSMDESEKEYAK